MYYKFTMTASVELAMKWAADACQTQKETEWETDGKIEFCQTSKEKAGEADGKIEFCQTSKEKAGEAEQGRRPETELKQKQEADGLLKFNCDLEVCRLIVRMLRTCHNGEELKLALYELDRKKMIYADEMGAVFIRTILPLLGYEATFDNIKAIIKRL